MDFLSIDEVLSDPDVAHDVGILRDWAEQKLFVDRVLLFGSRVHGTAGPDSDLDVAIVHGAAPGDPDALTTAFSRSKWTQELQPRMRLTLDLWPYREDEDPVIRKGLDAGSLVIFERSGA